MYKFKSVEGLSPEKLLSHYQVILCMTKTSRVKAKDIAMKEAAILLNDFDAALLPNGPLSELKGSFVLLVPNKKIEGINSALENLGYSNKFYLIDFIDNTIGNQSDLETQTNFIWKKMRFGIKSLYKQDEKKYIAHSTDNRPFRIIDSQGNVKDFNGYRGRN